MRIGCRVLCLGVLAISASRISAQQTPDANRAAAEISAAILEQAAWQDLFNGQDLTGWTGDVAGYSVEDGVLICKKGGKNLATSAEYSDFALQFEFKLAESGNKKDPCTTCWIKHARTRTVRVTMECL